jgi:hypothetical protein
MPRNIRPFVFARQRGWLPVLSTIAITLSLLPACGPEGQEGSPARTDSRNGWEYPIRLGDPRSKVHQFLGNAARTTEVLEEYPMSGVTTWFDLEGRLAKLNFHGKAGALYSGPNAMMAPNWIPSDRPLLFGLTAHADEADFRRRLGSPVHEVEAGPAKAKELRCLWRKDGYLIDALFLASDRTEGGKAFAKGCLVWCEVSPGL